MPSSLLPELTIEPEGKLAQTVSHLSSVILSIPRYSNGYGCFCHAIGTSLYFYLWFMVATLLVVIDHTVAIPLHRSISFYMYLYVSGTGGKLRLSVSVVLVTLCHGGYIIRMDIYFFAEMITLNVLASPNKPSSCMIVYMCHMDSNIQWHCVNSKIWCCTKLNYSLFNYYYN